MDTPPLKPSDADLHQALTRRVQRRTTAKGEIALPAVPGMLEDYVALCDATFRTLGVEFSAEELAHLRGVLRSQLEEAFAASPRSDVVISYESPFGLAVNYHVKAQWFTVEGAYDNWVATREPPLFGTEPDARVWELATAAADPAAFRVLDIGAGTGRNSLALARRGHPVDAVEMSPKFAEILRAEAQRENLDVRVIERDVFATTADDLRSDYDLILLSEVVSDFRTVEQVRGMFELAARCLSGGGQLVFNVFLGRDGYVPDAAVRELGQQCYTSIFTYPEIVEASANLSLELVADDSVYDYEKSHQPAESWPPTSWYENWVSGIDVFEMDRELSPIELRWLVYRKVWKAAPTTGNASPSSW
ncbi:MAG: class I SAM-dependent methyltransferase [Mycobacteriaceae bacterium]